MGGSLFDQQLAMVQAAYANGLGCDVSAFGSDELTIVDRPEPPAWPYTAVAITFGAGTVVSVDPAYRAIAETHRPERHWRAIYPPYMQELVEGARARGQVVSSRAPNLGFVLGTPPTVAGAPGGLELREVTAEWMNAQQASGRFDNGVGEGEADGRSFRNRFGVALFDASDEPVAIAGVFLTYGLHEIGVDVVRERRGEGLGRLVVTAVSRAILERGETAVYFCSATNVRSHRTALSCGFVPACTETSVA